MTTTSQCVLFVTTVYQLRGLARWARDLFFRKRFVIVRNIESGWEIVFQSAHALLAGQIATHLRRLPRIRYWGETLAAILEHDEHKVAFGKNIYLTELGAPKDFTQFRFTARERFEEVQRRIESGYRKHRWIGLLAARHAEELYRHEAVSKKLAELLDVERRKRPALLDELRTTETALEVAYAVFQWCDRTSLILCQNALPAMQRRIEIAPLGDGKRYEIWQNVDRNVSVHPWPFSSDYFDQHVEVRTITQLSFTADRELEVCLRQSPVEKRCWRFRKFESNERDGALKRRPNKSETP